MPRFRVTRSTTSADEAGNTSADTAPGPESPPKAGGKGRPTPKRREAQRQRRELVKAPTNRREAYRQRRDRIKGERRTHRRALTTGDERNLPPRDAGPVKRYVRDIVDSRRSMGSFFLPAALVLLFASTIKGPILTAVVSFGYVALLGAIIVDSFMLARQVRQKVTDRFGEKEAYGVRMYAVTRSIQFRRLRMPPPKVKRGGDPL